MDSTGSHSQASQAPTGCEALSACWTWTGNPELKESTSNTAVVEFCLTLGWDIECHHREGHLAVGIIRLTEIEPERRFIWSGNLLLAVRVVRNDGNLAGFAHQIWPDYESNHVAIADRRSALRWADRISAPLLIMHGGDDTTVSPVHALQLATELQRYGKPYELVIAADAKHTLQPFEAERDERAIRWFRRHLGPEHQ